MSTATRTPNGPPTVPESGTDTASAVSVAPTPPLTHLLRRVAARLVRRMISAVAALWVLATVTFAALHAVPGDIADIMAGEQSDPALRAAIRQQWGLDRPLLEQYLQFIGRLVRGDLGISYVQRQPVADVLAANIRPTIELASCAAAVAVVLAFSAAIATAGRSGWLRSVLSAVELVLVSVPTYWVGILALMLFAFQLGWFPIAGDQGPEALVLPSLSLALAPAALLSQVLREALDQTLGSSFVLTVRSRGVGHGRVVVRHALRHALVPVLNLMGSIIAALLGGSVLIEQVFGRPGLGVVALSAVDNKDIPVIIAVVLIIAIIYIVTSTVIDAMQTLVDPRARRSDG